MTGIYLSPLERIIKFVVDTAYMESGFLDLLNTAMGSADTYKPAKIRFNAFVAAKSALLVNASASRIVADYDESQAIGCTVKVGSVDMSNGSSIFHFDSDPAEFCEPNAIYAKKLSQAAVPSSVYTGKMRLMVQAIYGSKRSDYAHSPNSNGFDNLVLAGVSLGITTPTAGLYTAPDGTYWLINIGSSVSYRRLVISGNHEPIDLGEPLSEAYALGRLIPQPGGSEVTMSGSSLTSALAGMSPVAYGWKYNMAGNEAHIVVYKTATITGINAAGSTVSGPGIQTALLKVTIGWDAVDLVPTFLSVSTVTSGNHFPFQQTKVFAPFLLLSAKVMKCLTVSGSNAVFQDLSAPIYCYYDSTDTLVPITVKNSKFVSKAVDNSGIALSYINGQPVINWVSPGVHGVALPARKQWNQNGVVVGGDNFIRSPEYDNGSRQETIYKYPENITGKVDMGQLSLTGPNTTTIRYGFAIDSTDPTISARWIMSSLNRAENYLTAVVIPFDDANAVIVCEDDRATCDSYTINAYRYGNSGSHYIFEWWTKVAGNWGAYAYTTNPNWGQSLISGPSFAGPISQTQSQIDDAVKSTFYINKYRFQVAKLYSRKQTVEIYNAGELVGPNDALPTLELTPLFEIVVTDPFFYNPLSVRQSFSGATKYSFVGSIGNSIDWPSITHASPVGWA